MEQIHATCVDIGGAGVLLRGPSGSGKSDLALRLIDSGARLVADDRTELTLQGGSDEQRVVASAPKEIAGKIEARGLGILTMDALSETPVALVVDMVDAGEVERVPEPASLKILGLAIPLVRLDPFEVSAPAKLRAALKSGAGL
jgi:serine kinase of HPr protein (carbohydrate metabolism regulator)